MLTACSFPCPCIPINNVTNKTKAIEDDAVASSRLFVLLAPTRTLDYHGSKQSGYRYDIHRDVPYRFQQRLPRIVTGRVISRYNRGVLMHS